MSSTNLRERLRLADPAAETPGYPAERQAGLIARLVATDPVLGSERPIAQRPITRRPEHRLAWRAALIAAAAALAVGATTVGGDVLAPGSAVAAEMDRLAVGAAGPLPSSGYLYTESRQVRLSGGDNSRYWEDDTIRRWQGDSCNDRQDEVVAPPRFPTPEDERHFREQAGPPNDEFLRGWSNSWRGAELRSLDSVPCDQLGDFVNPNPPYAATYPTDPDAFLAKAVHDAGPRDGVPAYTPADAVLQLLALPYLSSAQRAAALRAFGRAAGDWTVTGHATVAGLPGVVIRQDLGPVEQELVITDQAPGVLRTILRITDPGHATAFDPRFAGMAAGTEVSREEVLTVGVVASLDATP